MSNEIKIVILVVLVLIFVKTVLILVGRNKASDTHIFVMWAMLTAASALTHNIYAVLGMIILIKLFYLKNNQEMSITAFFALWAVLPFHYVISNFPSDALPLMGGNYQRFLTLVWILPLMPKLISEARLSHRRVFMDLPFLIVLVLLIKLEFSPRYEFPPTLITSIKNTISLGIDFVIPYFVIVAWGNSWVRIKKLLWALLLSGLVLAVLGVMEAVRNWNIFAELKFDGMRAVSSFANYRDFLRVKTTFPEPISYGAFGILMLGIATALLLRSKRRLLMSLFAISLLMVALYATQSRGDWVGAVFMIVLFLFFRMRTFSRLFYITILVITVPVVGLLQSEQFATGTQFELSDVDETGTFQYRQELFLGMMKILPRHPFFGNSMYKAEPEMQALVQGQGIVDPVNTYMAMAVEQGLIALFFFLFVIIRSINTGLRYIKYGFSKNNMVWVHMGAALAALISGFAVSLAFTSFFATLVVYFWFAMGIARALQYNLDKKLAVREEKLADEWEESSI